MRVQHRADDGGRGEGGVSGLQTEQLQVGQCGGGDDNDNDDDDDDDNDNDSKPGCTKNCHDF